MMFSRVHGLRWMSIFQILSVFSNVMAAYHTEYLEDYCRSDEVIALNIGSASSNSSGILKSSRNGTFLQERNCTIFLQPPLGFGVVLSVRYLDFRPIYPPTCRSYVEVMDATKPVRLCGYSDDISEYQTYSSDGSPLQINFVTGINSAMQQHSDITFVVTSYFTMSGNCEMKMFQCLNSRCIWDGLKCDGHNNCGDQSDEYSGNLSNCGMLPGGAIVGIVVGSVMGLILLIIIPIACCRSCKRCKKNREDTPPLIHPSTDYNTMAAGNIQNATSATSYSSGLNSACGAYQDLPPAYKP